MATPAFTPAYSIPSHPLAALASGAPSQPSPAEKQQQWIQQISLQVDSAPIGAWGADRYAQTQHYTGAIALAAKPYLNAVRGAKVSVLQRVKNPRDGIVQKATAHGHYARDEEYQPADPDHPLCQIVQKPNGDRGRWSLPRELAFLTLQYLLTGDAPAWTPTNEAGKPVQFYALVSALTHLQIGPGADPRYPRGAYRVTPYGAGGFGMAGALLAGALLPAEEVARLTDEDPWMRGAGRSRLQAGADHIDVFESITKSRHSFFRKGTMLKNAIVLPGADADVCKQMTRQLEEGFGGADNQGRAIVVLGGGGMADKAAIQSLSMNSTEMGFLESFEQALEFVLALFGVPKAVASLGENGTYANNYAAKQLFYDNSLNPFMLRLSDMLTTALADPWSAEPGEFKIEVEPPLVGDLELEEKEREFAAQSGFITVNEYRKATGRDPVPDGDIPLSVYTAKLTQQFAPPPAPAPMPGDPNAAPGADAEQPQPGAEEQPVDPDSPEATQHAVGGAALAALGVPDDGAPEGQDDAEEADPLDGLLTKGLHKYASTHVELPDEIGDRLRALAAMIPDRDLGEDGREDEPHVTIRCGLEVDDPAEVAAVLRGFGPARLRLGKVSIFAGAESGKPYDVLKVEVDSLDLHELNTALADLPHTDTHPTYKPHATIAYVKAGLGEKYAEKMGRVDAEAVATEIVFSDCDRAQTRIPLDGLLKAFTPNRDHGKFSSAPGAGADPKTAIANRLGIKVTKPGQKPAPRPTPPPLPTAPHPNAAHHDELAKRLLNGRPVLRLLDGKLKGHDITDGASLQAFIAKGGKLPPQAYEEHAKSIPAEHPVAKKTLLSVADWAHKHADKHADKVAAHFGVSRERAHALLVHTITHVAKHAAKTGGRGATGTLAIGGKKLKVTAPPAAKGPTSGAPPRPANPTAAGSKPPTVGKAMNTLSGPDGGFLVEPGNRLRRRKKKVRACVAKVMKSLEQE